MAARRESNDDEEPEQKVMEKEISELRSAKKELFERSRPVNDELEWIAQRERECIDKLHRLIAEKHDREKRQQTIQRLIEESGLNRLKSEKQTLTRELPELHLETTHASETRSENADVMGLQMQLNKTTKLLNKTTEELYETRQLLSEVQERLTVAEQVTAATQRRALQESGNSEELPVRLQQTRRYQLTTHNAGDVLICK